MSGRAVIYARTAAGDSDHLHAQVAACERYAERQGYTIIERITERASGLDMDRDGLRQALILAATGTVDCVLVHDMTRLTWRPEGLYWLLTDWDALGVRVETIFEAHIKLAEIMVG